MIGSPLFAAVAAGLASRRVKLWRIQVVERRRIVCCKVEMLRFACLELLVVRFPPPNENVRGRAPTVLRRDLHRTRNLLPAAVPDVHGTCVERALTMLGMARAPVNLEQKLPIWDWVQRIESVDEIHNLLQEFLIVPVSIFVLPRKSRKRMPGEQSNGCLGREARDVLE